MNTYHSDKHFTFKQKKPLSNYHKESFDKKKELLKELLARGMTTRQMSPILCEKCSTVDHWRLLVKKENTQ